MPAQAAHGLLGRLCPDACTLEQLLLQMVRPTGQEEALQARLAYIRDLPARAEPCRLLQTVKGVMSAGAPLLLPDTSLEQNTTQAEVGVEPAWCTGQDAGLNVQHSRCLCAPWTSRCGSRTPAGACSSRGTARCA